VSFIFILHTSALPLVVVTVLPILLLFAISPSLFPPALESLTQVVANREKALNIALSDCKCTDSALRDIQQLHAQAKQLYDGLVQARDYPLSRLLSADVRAMSGPDFERFLAEVFLFLGYAVRPTGKTGDQGVDLIVSRGPEKVAVQAKCYSGTVGNWAVQEAFTGMTVHGCHRCAVITSSTFTASARNAAAATGCILIEGHQIGSLIRGKIMV
jgi:HJR/Mrr/RecB family endonuclease